MRLRKDLIEACRKEIEARHNAAIGPKSVLFHDLQKMSVYMEYIDVYKQEIIERESPDKRST